MNRELEPEVMDGQEQSAAYAAADFAEPNARFVKLLREAFPREEEGRWLDLGCGPADIPLRICAQLPRVQIWGVDASGPMLELARLSREAAAAQDRLHLVQARLPTALLEERHFDVVLSNSLLHHLPQPGVLWESIARHGAPGAAVFVADLRRPPSLEAAQQLVEAYAQGAPEILRRDFYHSLLAAFEPEEVEAQIKDAGLEGRIKVEVISDRHLVASGRLPA